MLDELVDRGHSDRNLVPPERRNLIRGYSLEKTGKPEAFRSAYTTLDFGFMSRLSPFRGFTL